MNEQALKYRLLEIAKESKVDFQTILTKLAEERFLARLSHHKMKAHFILKGGNLLANLLPTRRKTMDIDFAIKNLKSTPKGLTEFIRQIMTTNLDDGFAFTDLESEPLTHHQMEEPGIRFRITYQIGKMKNKIQIDLAIGDVVDPILIPYNHIKYHNKPLYPGEISLLAYSLEYQCAEKIQIIMSLGEATSRLRDFYDVFLIINSNKLDQKKLKQILKEVFGKRGTLLKESVSYSPEGLGRMQTFWQAFYNKQNLKDVPSDFTSIVTVINNYLK